MRLRGGYAVFFVLYDNLLLLLLLTFVSSTKFIMVFLVGLYHNLFDSYNTGREILMTFITSS